MNQTTTLKAIKAAGACECGYKKLLNNLGKKRADSKPLTLEEIYNSNGLNDALWCTLLMPETRPLVVKFAAACARRALHIYEEKYPGDAKPRKAIEAAENGSPDAAYAAYAAAVYAARAARAAYAADAAAVYAARAARAAYAADADAERAAQDKLFTEIFFNAQT